MAHIHTKPGQHDHTASGYIVRTDFPEPKVMLHYHKKLDAYLQFGGHIELDENPWQAVAHELQEETGYELTQLKILQPKERLKVQSESILHPWPVCHNTHRFNDEHFHTDIAYAFVTDQEPKHPVGESESGKFIFVTREELASSKNAKIKTDIRETGLFIFDVCLPKWEKVDTSEFRLSGF